jgi:endonuclease/exonuclease/phosphatase family metal-dependent hydrolase
MNLTIVTFNLRHNADEWERRAPFVVEELVRLRPHLIALQEVWLPIGQARWLAGELSARLASCGLGSYTCVERSHWGQEAGREGIAILSRLPLLDSAGVDLPHGGRIALAAQTQWNDRTVELICTHLHHEHPIDPDTMRLEQVRALHAWLDTRASAHLRDRAPASFTVLAGDFNALPDSYAAAALYARWRSAYAAIHGAEPAWTFGTPLADRNNLARGRQPWRGTLDYIFVPPDTGIRTARLVCDRPAPIDPPVYLSDHVGLLAELEL